MSLIYLSHLLSENTPFYGGNGRVQIERVRSMADGDSSNNSGLALPAHAGTHIDAPYHFDSDGATLDTYPPEFWQAICPWLLDASCKEGEILDLDRLGETLKKIPMECDLLLLRTRAEKWRTLNSELYAERGPGVAADVANWLRCHRRLKFIGLDFISVSSYLHREVGREAHKAFLASHESGNPPVLIIEDMALSELDNSPKSVWIVPLLYSQADGAPVTVLAQI